MFFVTGCSSEEIYDSVTKTMATDEELRLLAEGRLGTEVVDGDVSVGDGIADFSGNIGYTIAHSISSFALTYGWFIAGISFVLGLLIIRLSGKASNIKRTGLLVFVLFIPIVSIVTIFCSAFLADALK